jgi:membrane associated rhomboid family serine protease
MTVKEKLKIDFHIIFPFVLTLILWAVFYFDVSKKLSLADYGVWPRSLKGIPGIISHFFVHGNFLHILSNTLSLLVLSLFLFTGYKEIAFKVFLWMIPLTGMLLWLIGRSHEEKTEIVHIGASGVIFSLFGFLLVSGLIRKNKMMMALSALVIFLYGYMVWGIFPLEKQVSWDGHLSGLIAGIFLAAVFRKQGPQPDKFELDTEEEDELDKLPAEEKYWLKDDQTLPQKEIPKESNDQIFIKYHYRDEKKS